LQKPWPSMLRTVWGDDERYRAQYWSDIKGVYFTGDGAYRDRDGYIRVVGRVDDVLAVVEHHHAVPAGQAYDVAYGKALRHVLTLSVPPPLLDEAREALAELES